MFKQDLLLIDIESTGVDITKHEMIQLAAILLDKKTLKAKKTFNEFIKPTKWRNRDPEAMAVCNITWDQVKDAPDLKTVLRKFDNTFGNEPVITTYGGNLDIIFFPAHYRKVGKKYPFDYHTFNIWPLCYVYMAKKKKLTNKKRATGFSLEDVAKHFKIPVPTNRHDALADCELEAEVLRHLVKHMKV